ncbi:NAD(P) transhydrogenase subunit alpha [Thiohalorhabdus denitrificans]|uniref:proton-translocating NAD(P)(+) transhydrogenase n=1 Tax=Thiohalorhabdus denitrificans TaxID=381306 RepID=A0A0P9C490_9GAMM|nr:NAD(P) transhydrogenase subunit alpha [Thiohalorhabdus denitrificans]KPV39608.1 NAD(P) transhydrogenase subunit alpha [Thiohalorhabdus denitrificans]SCX96916.1 NAD(P) transhydrogenase subunit alpha [Thiohalorhabdus denitrificans]
MAVKLGVPKETAAGECRVALVPAVAAQLMAKGLEVRMQPGAGAGAFFADGDYHDVRMVEEPADLYREADVLLRVQPPTPEEIDLLGPETAVLGFLDPLGDPDRVARLRDRGVTAFAMELVPRIARAQSMDALSSQASIAGYKAALLAADLAPRFFPMLTTAAGTVRPAKVLVLGAGVAGLQAIATAHRLGASVFAYDVRPETREQAASLGATFLDLDVSGSAEGGYARELTDEEKRKEQELLGEQIAGMDVVITTAAVPGRPAPVLVREAEVTAMRPGSVIVDLAAETGGNCECTVLDETVRHEGVMIHGPRNVPGKLPVHASEMYARNLANFLDLLVDGGHWGPDWEDEVVAKTVLTRNGEIVPDAVRERVEGGAS